MNPHRTILSFLVFGTIFLCGGETIAQAETEVSTMKPTSATDANVKIHNSRRMFLFRPSHMKSRAKSTEREGQAMQRQRSHVRSGSKSTETEGQAMQRSRKTRRLNNESQVFQRHNHFARKEKSARAKPRAKKVSGRN